MSDASYEFNVDFEANWKMRVRRRENLEKAADREMALEAQRQAAPQKVDLTEWGTHTR